MSPILITAISLAGIAVIFFVFIYIIYRIVFYTPVGFQKDLYFMPLTDQVKKVKPSMDKAIDKVLSLPYEQVFISSYDGLRLAGKYYHFKDGAPLDISFHGYRGNYARDMSGSAAISVKTEHNFLLIDQRGHGLSQGHTLSFGIKERFDVLSWVDYAVKRFGDSVKILLNGVSMGATTVLMSTEFNLPKNVRAVVADCPYSSPKDIIIKVCKDKKCPPKIFYPLIKLSARLYGGFKLDDNITAANAVKNAKVPILILHGEEDRFVPMQMSEQVYSSNPEKVTRYTFPNAGHGLSYLVRVDDYEKVVTEFINKHC